MRISSSPLKTLHGMINAHACARRRWKSTVGSLDAALSGGFAYGHTHEFFAAEAEDMAATAGFALALVTGMAEAGKDVLWLRSTRAAQQQGVLQANGWAEMGAAPENFVFAIIPDAKGLLRAAVDALRSNALGAVIAEAHGCFPELDMITSRRLALAAEKSGTTLLLLRSGAEPAPSAAETRWQVAAAPSHALPANAPGAPVFAIELLRQRSGPSSLSWQLEWNRDRRIFTEAASGDLVSVPRRGSPAAAGAGPVRFGQRAA